MKYLAFLCLVPWLASCTFVTSTAPDRPLICFAFDDQHHNVYELALPVMRQYGYRGTCFVNSGLLGADGLLSRNQLDELHHTWHWEVGGHSLQHENLDELNYAQAETAIVQDWQNLVAWGYAPRAFALPRGICPVEYHQLITSCYQYIRGSQDLAMHVPLNTQELGYFAFQSGWTAETVKNRIRRGIADHESLILIGFHRIEDPSSNYNANCPLEVFTQITEYVYSLGLEVLPFSEAIDKLN